MVASLQSVVPYTGKAAPASAGSLFPLDEIETTANVEKILSHFPSLPPRVVLALAVAHLLSRTVTPQRLCVCGCGAYVTGKAITDGPACRKRLERQRRASAGAPGRQFNLVMQDEMPMKIANVPPPAPERMIFPWVDCDHSGYISLAHDCPGFFCTNCGKLISQRIPSPPEQIGYLSACWKWWEENFPNRYPSKVRSQFAALPADDDEEKSATPPPAATR